MAIWTVPEAAPPQKVAAPASGWPHGKSGAPFGKRTVTKNTKNRGFCPSAMRMKMKRPFRTLWDVNQMIMKTCF